MKKVRYLNKTITRLLVLLVMLSSIPSMAQDGIGDASTYKLQRRYRAKDKVPFKSYSFIDNSYVGFAFGRTNCFRQEYSDGVNAAIVLGKWFNPYHGIRLEPVFGTGKDNFDGNIIIDANLNASYLFNLTHYLWGYDPYRLWDMSAVAGVGAAYYAYDGTHGMACALHLGMNFSFRVHKGISIFLEPVYNLSSDPHLNKHDDGWRSGFSSLKTTVGVCYNFQNRDYDYQKTARKTFVFGSVGAISNNTLIKDGAFLAGMGLNVNAGVGVICKPWLGFRTAIHLSNCLWNTKDTSCVRSTTYAGLRLEAVFDILPMFNSRFSESRCGLAIFLGPEVGYMRKTDKDLVISSLYAGLSGGLQFKVRIISHLSLLLEPRFSVVPYSAPTDAPPPHQYYERNYYDLLSSLSLGVQYSF